MPDEDVVLETEQEQLLDALVRASRNTPRDSRRRFIYIATNMASWIQHPGLPDGTLPAYRGDIEALANEGLLFATIGSTGTLSFDVSPRGFKHYERMKARLGEPTRRVELEVHGYLDSEPFQRDVPEAYQKWRRAEALLWGPDSAENLTAIGHLCREGLQLFASALVARFQPEGADLDQAHSLARVRSVMAKAKTSLPEKVGLLLDALISYWAAVSGLTQRQEHGTSKEGEPLSWEDARRLVFQTANLFFEIHTALYGRG